MKIVKILLALFSVISVLNAQEINQFDDAGKRHGVWRKNFEGTNVIRYEGQFDHGKEVGEFKFYKNIRNKPVLSATKHFDSKSNVADVQFLASNGKVISEGKMDGKVYIGTWKYYQKDSENLLILENFNNAGELHGERYVYFPNKQIAEQQNYNNGKLEGEAFIYSEKGVLLKAFLYENDELHGMSKYYNAKGELITEGKYKRGKKDGVWNYYENDTLVRSKDFTYKPKYIKKAP